MSENVRGAFAKREALILDMLRRKIVDSVGQRSCVLFKKYLKLLNI